MATCPPVVDDKVCKNNKFSSTGETKVSSFSKPLELPQIAGSVAVVRSTDIVSNSEIYIRISSTKVVEYKVITFKSRIGIPQYEKKQSQWKRTLKEIKNDPSLSIFTIGDIEELINKARTEIGNFLSKFIPKGSGGSVPVAISGQTSQRPTENQNLVGTAPRTGSSQSTTGKAGQTGPTSEAGGAGISGASGASALDSLQDTGYLNTSKPKDYPIIDQPGGTYKPLSDTSRFVFEKADSFNEKDALGDFSIEKESQEVGKRFPNTNRKYFGANLAVLNKLESTDFVSSYTKPDYIAYLIPYGSPALASNQTNTTSIGFVPEDNKKILESNILASPVENISKLSPKGKELYQSSYVVLQKKNGNTESVDSLNKKAEAEWVKLINEKKTESILFSINSVYDDKNYKSFENQINNSTKITKPKDYKNLISDLKRYFDSYKNSKFEVRPFNLGTTPQDLIGLSNKAKENNFLGLAAQTLPKDLKYDVSKAISGLSADPFNISNTTDPGTKGVDPGLKVWQFLYNPQSITIDVKADYAESNTWGATDDGQSGRSVQWLRNQNPVMRLDEVVLNGFIHNKKVGQLEEGLFALLMSRDGPGQIQPTIWEFVWGKRRFGPCVINNIQVVEKQWEAGEVLAATVSFELIQIPKWQIIDSTVKFYDPEAFSQFAATGTPGASGAGGGTTPGGTAPGGGGRGGETGKAIATSDPCQKEFIKGLNNLAKTIPAINFLINCRKAYDNDPTYAFLYKLNRSRILSEANSIVKQNKCNKLENKSLTAPWAIINFTQQEEYPNIISYNLANLLNKVAYCKRNQGFRTSSNANEYNNLLNAIKNNITTGNIQVIFNNYKNILFSSNQKVFGSKQSALIEIGDIYGEYLAGGSTIGIRISSRTCAPNNIIIPSAGNNNPAALASRPLIISCQIFLYVAIAKYMNKRSIPIKPSLKIISNNGYYLEIVVLNNIPKYALLSLPNSTKSNVRIDF